MVSSLKGKQYNEDNLHNIVEALKGVSTDNVKHAMNNSLWELVIDTESRRLWKWMCIANAEFIAHFQNIHIYIFDTILTNEIAVTNGQIFSEFKLSARYSMNRFIFRSVFLLPSTNINQNNTKIDRNNEDSQNLGIYWISRLVILYWIFYTVYRILDKQA